MDTRSSLTRKLLGAAVFGGLTILTATLGARAARKGKGRWYRQLEKPALTPPDRVFSVVWRVLYPLIAISGYRVWKRGDGRSRRRALGLWGTQLALNAAWTPLFFARRRFRAAMVNVVALLAATAAYTRQARRMDKRAPLLMAPYLAWIAFATYLNAEILRRNRGKLPSSRST